jgi:hypothetical protein
MDESRHISPPAMEKRIKEVPFHDRVPAREAGARNYLIHYK